MAVGLVLGAILLFASGASAATLSWTAPTTGIDNTTGATVPLTSAEISRLIYTPYVGSSSSGPWTAGAATAAGATSAPGLSEPARGSTLWYTADATLDGLRGNKAPAVSKVGGQVPRPNPPGSLQIQ
jgi:hypothetical protein